MRRRERRAADQRFRVAERNAYAAYGAHPQEQVVEVATPTGTVPVRVLVVDGPDDAPPVLLLHGITSATVLAAPLLPALRGRKVYAVDWPGHGLSGPSVIHFRTAFRAYAVQTLLSLLDELDLTTVDLVGHSLGAQISLYGALTQDSRNRRVVLLGAPGASLEGTRPLTVMKLLALPRVGEKLLRVPQSERTFAQGNDMALGAGALDGVPQDMVTALQLIAGRRSNASSLAAFFRSLIKRGSLRAGVPIAAAELAQVHRPVLLVWGEEDSFLTPTSAARSIALLPDAQLVRVTGAGHAPWLQDPELVSTSITDHLNVPHPTQGVVS